MIKINAILLLLMTCCMVCGQEHEAIYNDKKQLSLEELNFGGVHYNEMSPEKRYYVWHNDDLIRREIDKVFKIESDKTEYCLFCVNDLKAAFGRDSDLLGVNLLDTEFPYADKPLALINVSGKRLLYDYLKKKVVFVQNNTGSLEWNAKSKIDVFSKEDNIWLRRGDGTEQQLTTDGSRDIVYGRSVHRDEFGIKKGTFFSPTGKMLAFYRMDQSMVEDYPHVNIFENIASCELDKYPMAGRKSHKVTIGVRNIEVDTTVWLDLGDVTNRYFTNISWAPDSRSLYLIELNRGQTVATLDQYDALTGKKIRTVLTEENSKYVEPQYPISFLPWDENKFVYWSQKDGYWHLYLYDVNTGECIKTLTKGKYVVTDLCGFCAEKHSIIIRANKENPLQCNLYAVCIDDGSIRLIDNGKGSHECMVSASGSYLLDVWSAPDVPKAWCLHNIVEENSEIELGKSRDPWTDYVVPIYRQGELVAADGNTTLYYRMVLPHDFDEKKKYPVVVYVYGGPHVHNVEATWHWNSRSWETYMANKGYVIFVLDNRGSERRGIAFEQATYCQLGQVEMADQMKGVEYLCSLPYVDKDRIGIHGWSFGGFMTITLMANHPETFKVGVAGGPVIDWSKYEVMYTERYMKTPEQNPEGYEKTCLLGKAKDIKGRLLVITGMNDSVVVPQQSLLFLNACNEVGTQCDFYVYPGENHNMKGHMSVHLHDKISRYFEDYLK